MLRPPYNKYNRLFVYNLDLSEIPSIDDPDLIAVWVEEKTVFLFFHKDKKDLIRDLCRSTNSFIIYQADLAYNEWEAGIPITTFTVQGVTVSPVWESGPADIRIDPSVIFGSGFHPTTKLCMKSLIKLMRDTGTKPEKVLDLGTGTGLLAIVAAFCGAKNVIAMDNNTFACELAEANVQRNVFQNNVDVQCVDLMKNCPDTSKDIVMANLYKGLLLNLFDQDAFWQARYYILSGFTPEMEPDLLAAIPAKEFTFLERNSEEIWRSWVLERKSG